LRLTVNFRSGSLFDFLFNTGRRDSAYFIHPLTRSLKWVPGLKRGRTLEAIETISPVLGLHPVLAAALGGSKVPKPANLTGSTTKGIEGYTQAVNPIEQAV